MRAWLGFLVDYPLKVMLPNLHLFFLFLLVQVLILIPALSAEDDDWDALMEESRQAEQLLDTWTADTQGRPATVQRWQQQFELLPLAGWTDNLLRSREKVFSAYVGAQADWFALGLPDSQSRVTGFALLDYRHYTASVDVDSETLVLAGAEWLLQPNEWAWFVGADFYYGDHIFELFEQDIGVPVDGERFRQYQLGGHVGVQRDIARGHTLRLQTGAYSNWFGESFYDFDEWRVRLEHRWQASENLRVSSHYQFGDENYSELFPRDSNGVFLLDQTLRIQRHQIAIDPSWNPAGSEALSLRLGLSHEWFRDVHGAYSQRQQTRFRPSLQWRQSNWEHRLGFELSAIRYAERPASLVDLRRLHQNRLAASYSAAYLISERQSIGLQYAFTEVDSRRTSDSYRRHQIETHWRFGF